MKMKNSNKPVKIIITLRVSIVVSENKYVVTTTDLLKTNKFQQQIHRQ